MNKLGINSDTITITNDRSDAEINLLTELAKHVPAIHSNRKGDIHKVSSRYIKDVLRIYRNIHNVEELPANIQEVCNYIDTRKDTTDYLKEADFSHLDDFLMEHQRKAVALASINNRYAFYYDTRTGKTPMSLKIINDDIEKNPSHKWLIICPLVLINNAWIEDAKQFFPSMNIVSLHASTKEKRLKQFKLNANVYIQNIESFVNWQDEIEKLNIHAVFVDESSVMKSATSKQSKALVEYSQKVKRWYLLSGTPAVNGEHEYYMQLKSIDKHIVPSSYTAFKTRYFNNASYNPQFEKLRVKPELEDKLKKLISTVAIYVDKEDVLELPGRTFNDIIIDVPQNVKTEYKRMKDELYYEIPDKMLVTAPNEAAKINKLRQIASGFIYDSEGKASLISMFKFNALFDLLNKIGDKQVLIFANYKYEFTVISKLLGARCMIINGTVTLQQKEEALNRFKNGTLQYLIVNPSSLSMGVTLTNCHTCVYFSMDYSYERYYQSRDRIYADKRKQKHHCNYYFIMCKNTVDTVIKNAVDNKGDMSKAILNYLKRGE